MPDDLTPHYRRLAHTAALVGEFDGSPDRQAELLRWTLEAVREIARAQGLQIEPRPPEPMPHRISRDLFPAQGASSEAVCDRILTAAGENLRERSEAGAEAPRLVALAWDAEVGCRVTEDAAERVLQAGERRRAAEEPPIEAGAGFAPGELARPVRGGVEEREE
jgi:hypothetical protein